MENDDQVSPAPDWMENSINSIFFLLSPFLGYKRQSFPYKHQTQDHSWVNPPSWREARLPLILKAFYWIFCHKEDFYRNMLNLGEGMIRSVSGESGEEFLNDRDRWMLSW